MTLLLLLWYCCFWASLTNWCRYFGRPDLGTAAVHLATAPAAVLVDIAIWTGCRRVEFPGG